ncbi:MAG TPA: NUDIX domain-containing protein [Phycisphaerales bacterium]|nr:NUDIX domain-containing protein [Phycisphaerales bacterium]
MAKVSAGILLYRRKNHLLEVLLAHPGGPVWANKDAGAWTIPKGGVHDGEELLAAALREFEEEIGTRPAGAALPLNPVKMRSGKTVHAFAIEGTLDTAAMRSNTFEMEWPPRSGTTATFPEIDRAEFFTIDEARRRIHPAQSAFLDDLERAVAPSS